MKVFETEEGAAFEANVKPRSKRFKVQVNEKLLIFCRQPPIEGKVNRELVKELSKIFGGKVEIVAGHRSRTKLILVKGATEERILKGLASLKV